MVHHGIPCYEMQLGDVCLPQNHPDAINCDDSVVFDTFRRYTPTTIVIFLCIRDWSIRQHLCILYLCEELFCLYCWYCLMYTHSWACTHTPQRRSPAAFPFCHNAKFDIKCSPFSFQDRNVWTLSLNKFLLSPTHWYFTQHEIELNSIVLKYFASLSSFTEYINNS